MSDELEQVPAIAGAPTMGRFGQWLPGIRFHTDPGTGGDGGAAAVGDGAGAPAGDAGAALAGGAGAGTAADAVADGTGAAAVAAPPPAPATPAWEDPAFLDLVDNRAQQLFQAQMQPLVPLLEQLLGPADGAGAAAAGTATAGELNPWDPTFAGNLEARFQRFEQMMAQGLDRLAAPLAAREQAETAAQGEQKLKDMLHDDIARNGDFPRAIDPQTGQPAAESKAEKLVMPLARLLFPEIQGRFGATPRAAELAITRAAGLVREIIGEARASAATTEANRLATLANANTDVGAAAVGLQTVGERQLKGWDDFSSDTARHAALIRGDR